MNRIVWVDYGKAIAIYLVVLAHTALNKSAEELIYTFHMPFFFFISGFLFSFDKYPSYWQFAKKRFTQLIIPYIIINILTYLFWLLISSKVGSDANETTAFYEPIIATFLANAKEMKHNVPLWFLVALFMVENLYYLLYKNRKYNLMTTLTLLVLALLNNEFNDTRLPFCIDIAVVATIFYAFGNMLQNKGKGKNLFKTSFFIFSTAITFLAFITNGKVSMHTDFYNNIIIFFAGGLAGCYSLAFICKKMQDIFGDNRIIRYLAGNTLLICAFHLSSFTFMKGIMLYVFKINPKILSGTLFANMIFAIISIAICLLVSYIINKYMPIISGRRQSFSPKAQCGNFNNIA